MNFTEKCNNRGVVIIWFAIGIVALISCVGLAVDMGHIMFAKSQQQNATDAAALAGATELPNEEDAINSAKVYAGKNGVTPDDGKTTLTGHVDPYKGYSTVFHVEIQKEVPTFFMAIVGINTVSINTSAAAIFMSHLPIDIAGDGSYGTSNGVQGLFGHGPQARKSYGDPFTPLKDDKDGCNDNVDHRRLGYNYWINVPTTFEVDNGTSRLMVEIFDPDSNNNPPTRKDVSTTTFDEIRDSACDGGTTFAVTEYKLYAPDNTPSYFSDDVLIAEATYSEVDYLLYDSKWICPPGFAFDTNLYGVGNYRLSVEIISGSSGQGYRLRAGPDRTIDDPEIIYTLEWTGFDWDNEGEVEVKVNGHLVDWWVGGTGSSGNDTEKNYSFDVSAFVDVDPTEISFRDPNGDWPNKFKHVQLLEDGVVVPDWQWQQGDGVVNTYTLVWTGYDWDVNSEVDLKVNGHTLDWWQGGAGNSGNNTEMNYSMDVTSSIDADPTELSFRDVHGNWSNKFKNLQLLKNGAEVAAWKWQQDVVLPGAPSWEDILFKNWEDNNYGDWHNGGGDCTIDNDSGKAHQGNRSLRLRDNSSSSDCRMNSSMDISAYTQLKISFWYITDHFSNNEDFWLKFSSNGGSNWTRIADYNKGSTFNNGSFYNSSVTINNSSYSFNSNARLRFECDASNNDDKVWIDEIKVEGYKEGGGLVEDWFEPDATAKIYTANGTDGGGVDPWYEPGSSVKIYTANGVTPQAVGGGGITGPFDPANGTTIAGLGDLCIEFFVSGVINIRLGYIPLEAAGTKLHIDKFDTDVGAKGIIYTFPDNGLSYNGTLAGNGSWKDDVITLPEDFSGGNLFARYQAGANDTSVWRMWFEGHSPGLPGQLKLVK